MLIERYGPQLVGENERALDYLVEATKGAKIQTKILLADGSVEGAWREAHRCCLPTSDAGKEALKQSLSRMKMRVGQDPLDYFIAFDEILATLRAVDVCIPEGEIVAKLRRSLSSDFDVEKRSTLMDPGMTRELLEDIVYSAHNELKLTNVGRQHAVPSLSTADQHALHVGGGNFRRDCWGGFEQQDDLQQSYGGVQQQQQQLCV